MTETRPVPDHFIPLVRERFLPLAKERVNPPPSETTPSWHSLWGSRSPTFKMVPREFTGLKTYVTLKERGLPALGERQESRNIIIIFDGHCNACNSFVNFMLNRSRTLRHVHRSRSGRTSVFSRHSQALDGLKDLLFLRVSLTRLSRTPASFLACRSAKALC